MFEGKLNCGLVIRRILFSFRVIVIDIRSVENRFSLVEMGKGMGVVTTARVKRRG